MPRLKTQPLDNEQISEILWPARIDRPGIYEVKVKSVEQAVSKRGNPYLRVEFEALDGAKLFHSVEPGSWRGQQLTAATNPGALEGQTVMIDVIQKEYEHRLYLHVHSVYKL